MIFSVVSLCAFPLAAERITFNADSMTGRAGSSSDTTVLKGNAYVCTSSMEISAASITMSGKSFRYIDAEGFVSGKNTDSRLEFKCGSVHYDRQTKVSTFKNDVSFTDTENGVDVKAQLVEYDQETDIASIQINAVITQKDNICKGAFAAYRKKEQMLELNGGAEIKQGEDTFHAQVITLNLDTQEITLDGKVKGSVVDNKDSGNGGSKEDGKDNGKNNGKEGGGE